MSVFFTFYFIFSGIFFSFRSRTDHLLSSLFVFFSFTALQHWRSTCARGTPSFGTVGAMRRQSICRSATSSSVTLRPHLRKSAVGRCVPTSSWIASRRLSSAVETESSRRKGAAPGARRGLTPATGDGGLGVDAVTTRVTALTADTLRTIGMADGEGVARGAAAEAAAAVIVGVPVGGAGAVSVGIRRPPTSTRQRIRTGGTAAAAVAAVAVAQAVRRATGAL